MRAAARDAALVEQLTSNDFDPEQFTPADHAALGDLVLARRRRRQAPGRSGRDGGRRPGHVAPWGFDPGQVRAPVLLLHGGQDRVAPSSHAEWLATRIRSAELWLRPDDGHISVLNSAEAALDWLWEHASQG